MSDENKVEQPVEAEEKKPAPEAAAAEAEAKEPAAEKLEAEQPAAEPETEKPAVKKTKAAEKAAKAEEPAPASEAEETAAEAAAEQPAAETQAPAGEAEEVAEEPKAATPRAAATPAPARPESSAADTQKPEGEAEQRDDRRRGRSFDRDSSDFRPRRPGGGRGRYRSFYRRKYCKFCSKKAEVSYRDADTLRRFITDRGKILPRRITGTCPKHQRQLSVAIKQARILALLPFVEK